MDAFKAPPKSDDPSVSGPAPLGTMRLSPWSYHFSRLSDDLISKKNLSGKFAIVTGSNVGIGKEIAKYLAERGATVILACRSEEKGKGVIADLTTRYPLTEGHYTWVELDLADLDSVSGAIETIKGMTDRVDILINNGGIMNTPFGKTRQGFELQFGVNYLGHFKLTMGLLDLLAKSEDARVVCVSSGWHDLVKDDKSFDLDYVANPSELAYDNSRAYGVSKLATNYFVKSLNEKCQASDQYSNITVYAVHPGIAATELTRYWAPFAQTVRRALSKVLLRTPQQGAVTPLVCALNPDAPHFSGQYFAGGVPCLNESPMSREIIPRQRLWERSLQWTGMRDPFPKSSAFADIPTFSNVSLPSHNRMTTAI